MFLWTARNESAELRLRLRGAEAAAAAGKAVTVTGGLHADHSEMLECLDPLRARPAGFSQEEECWQLDGRASELVRLFRLNWGAQHITLAELQQLAHRCPAFAHEDGPAPSAETRIESTWSIESRAGPADFAHGPRVAGDRRPFSQLEARLVFMTQVRALTRFLDERKVAWFMHFGGLIGALRQRDLNPWNDDIDLCILEPGALAALVEFEKAVSATEGSSMEVELDFKNTTWSYGRLMDRKTGVFTEVWVFGHERVNGADYVVSLAADDRYGLCGEGVPCKRVYRRDWVYPLRRVEWAAEPGVIVVPHKPRMLILNVDNTMEVIDHPHCCQMDGARNFEWPHSHSADEFYVCQWLRTQALKRERDTKADSIL